MILDRKINLIASIGRWVISDRGVFDGHETVKTALATKNTNTVEFTKLIETNSSLRNKDLQDLKEALELFKSIH